MVGLRVYFKERVSSRTRWEATEYGGRKAKKIHCTPSVCLSTWLDGQDTERNRLVVGNVTDQESFWIY